MSLENELYDESTIKLKKRIKVVGILILINVFLRYCAFLLLKFLTAMSFVELCYFPLEYLLLFLHSFLSVLYIIIGIGMVRGKSMGVVKYLKMVIIIEMFMVFWSVFFIFFSQSRIAMKNLIYPLLALEVILPLVGLFCFKKVMKSDEIRNTFEEGSKVDNILFVLLLVIGLIGAVLFMSKDLNNVNLYRECKEKLEKRCSPEGVCLT